MPAGKEIKRLREEKNVSAEKLAELIGVKPERLRKWESRDVDPRELDKIKVEQYFGVTLDELGNLSNFDFNKGPQKDSGVDSLKALSGLIETNKALAEANKTLADAHKIIANSNGKLVELARITVGDGKQIPLALESRFSDLLELVAEVGSGKKWHSKKEALAELSRRQHGNLVKT